MVSVRRSRNKKRAVVAVDSEITPPEELLKDVEPIPKKSKINARPKSAAKATGEKATNSKKDVVADNDGDLQLWPEADLLKLIQKVENSIPPKDTLRYDSRVQHLDWDKVAFGKYSAQECKQMWLSIQKRIRRYRLLKEVTKDAKAWVSRPWTNFYSSKKQNRHPDQPRRPHSVYMIFYLDKKDIVVNENPNLEMTEISKKISFMFKNLSEKEKQVFVQKAAQQRMEYKKKLTAFYKQHPECILKTKKRLKPKKK